MEAAAQIDPARALDSSTTRNQSWRAGFYVALGEQFTHFGTLQLDRREVANRTGQYLDSSITQLAAGYSISSRLGLQINAPIIRRSFERPAGFEIHRGTETGLGDISLLAKYLAFHTERGGSARDDFSDSKSPHIVSSAPDFTASAVLMTGVKFPTGDTHRIKEEIDECPNFRDVVRANRALRFEPGLDAFLHMSATSTATIPVFSQCRFHHSAECRHQTPGCHHCWR